MNVLVAIIEQNSFPLNERFSTVWLNEWFSTVWCKHLNLRWNVCRLLGPTTAADVLQLTSTTNAQAGPAHTRVVLSNNDLRIISRQEEDILEELFQVCYSLLLVCSFEKNHIWIAHWEQVTEGGKDSFLIYFLGKTCTSLKVLNSRFGLNNVSLISVCRQCDHKNMMFSLKWTKRSINNFRACTAWLSGELSWMSDCVYCKVYTNQLIFMPLNIW